MSTPQTSYNPFNVVDAVAAVFPEIAGKAVNILVCISALGAVNGLIFTGARISYALGAEHTAFRALGIWNGTVFV